MIKFLTILVPPLRNIVTAFEFLHSSITSILSLVVPKVISRTTPAEPSLSDVSSWKRGTIRPPVAIAMSSISGPPTHLEKRIQSFTILNNHKLVVLVCSLLSKFM